MTDRHAPRPCARTGARDRRALTLAARAAALGAVLGAAPALASSPQDLPDLTRLSLEELAQVEITSVSRRAEPVSDAAAAVYVISAEDIRRSGASSLPEVLRLAPNLQVQRMTAGEYAISARGFNGFETSNKLLVMIDGRSIYSPLHSGVFWDTRSMMIENIERIEVISGPGGALYGANAVNGVINIITYPAAQTQDGLVSAGIGDEDSTLSARYGGSAGEQGAWRAFVTAFDRDESLHPDMPGEGADAISGVRAGARADWRVGAGQLTVSGDIWTHDTTEDDGFTGRPIDLGGGNLLADWTHPVGDGALQVQGYYDRTERVGDGFDELVDTWDLHLQHAFALGGGQHQIVWGGGYRSIRSALETPSASAGLIPPILRINLASLFIQDQIALRDDLTLTLGAKIEDNSLTGQEFLPSARIAWRRPDGSLVWGAVSRAARTPSRIELGLNIPGLLAPADVVSERALAYELGYRATPTPRSSVSVSAFYTVYDDLRTVGFRPAAAQPLYFANDASGENWGLEAWGDYDMNERWRLSAGLSLLEEDFEVDPGRIDAGLLASTGDDPAWQVLLRSQADLTDALELDVRLRAVDSLATVDSYVEADVRLGWRLNERVELAINGQNLLDDRRLETGDSRRRAFGRSVYATVRLGF